MADKLTDFATLRGAARLVGAPAGTLLSADLPRRELADGTIVVRLADVRAWATKRKRGPGRPRKIPIQPRKSDGEWR